MDVSPLELLAKKYGNKVVYDSTGGVAGVFVRFPKMKSNDLDPELPNHTHPAFIIDGVEQDAIWLGKYKAGELSSGGTLYSLPGILPMRSLDMDGLLQRMKAAGSGITGMTVADYGFLLLLAQKEGWDPHGNTNYGQWHNDATVWETDKALTIGTVRAYEGWTYTCLQAHTTSAALKPDIAPAYWQREKQIGGVSIDTAIDATHQTGYRTVNGSGPMEWYLGNDPGSMADIIGSSIEANYGHRLVNCELQILPNNNAASLNADLSGSSSAWRAILPNANDDGYTLVTPGTTGTLHWTWANSKITLDNVAPTFDNQSRGTNFNALGVNTTHVPYVPHIIKELGLFPTTGSSMRGLYYINFSSTERLPWRGGAYRYGNSSGLGYVNSAIIRSLANEVLCARPRWIPT